MVRMHELQRLASEDSRAVELPAIGEHLGEAKIVAGGGEQAVTAATKDIGRINRVGGRNVDPVVDAVPPSFELACDGRAWRCYIRPAIHCGQAISFVWRDLKSGIRHSERLKQPFA